MLSVINKAQGGATYISPFIQRHGDPEQVPVLASIFTANEVDQYGFLKPGVFLAKVAGASATLVGAAPAFVHGVTVEAQKIAATNSVADLAAAGTVQVVVGRRGLVSRAMVEEMLGRVLTANELAGVVAAGSHIALQQP
jgi:regulator of RNase E activity RraA